MQIITNDFLTEYFPPAATAKALRVHPQTLKRWRRAEYGPKPVKVGGRLFYRVSDVQQWLGSLEGTRGRGGQ